ncbi:hypothetical protein K8I28_09620 [bacterium]|nr:hypothetical protein [bacterium]
MRTTRSLWMLLLTFLFLSIGNNSTFATPEYAMQYNQTCFLCHQSPSGGGMRNLYGVQFFSYADLPWNVKDFSEIGAINPMIGENLQVGVDFRNLYYVTQTVSEGTNAPDHNSFITMQGDIYLAFTPNDKTLVYFDKGLRGTFEAFAQFQGLPWHSYVKVGHFQPSYGWRVDDHKAYTRQFTGFGGEQNVGGFEDGVEYGFFPNGGDLSVAVTNGAAGVVDGDQGKAITARGLKRLPLGKLNLAVGASYRYAQFGGGTALNQRWGGLFGGLSYGKISYLGGADYIVDSPWIDAGENGILASNILRYQLGRGVYLNGHYDYFDPNLDKQSGVYWRMKVAAELIPYGYLRFLPAVEFNHSATDREYISAELQVHLWF